MKIENQQLRSFLIGADIITEEQFNQISQRAVKENKKISDILVAEEFISEEDLIKMKAYILGIPFINLEEKKIDANILKIIPEPIARSHNIIAFKQENKKLEVAMTDPEDLGTIDFIRKKSGLTILPRLTTMESIKKSLRQYHQSLETEFGDIIKKEEKEAEEVEVLEKVAEEVSVVRIVDTLIKHATLQGASDIHIEPQEKELIVRYRIDGILRDAMVLPINIALGVVARIKVLSNLKLDEHRLPQDGRFKVNYEDSHYSLRVSILPVSYGEKVVMRLLPETTEILTLEEIGLKGDSLENVKEALKKTTGMILVTGPTGSGKTSTLYTVIDMLNTPRVNISTVEDPIEYQIKRVAQTQVNPKIGLTFATGLRSLVRQDPDIIMVGEIRDEETASLAVNAALTGHLVLSTLHTTSAAGAVSRLMDMEIESFLISSTLNIIIAQRLVRRLHKSKKEYRLEKSDIESLKKYFDINRLTDLLIKEGIISKGQSIQDVPFFKPGKTKDCPDGYQGRVGIFEVLKVSDNIRKIITKKPDSMEIHKAAQEEGMVSLMESGFIKAAQGITSIEEVLRVIIE